MKHTCGKMPFKQENFVLKKRPEKSHEDNSFLGTARIGKENLPPLVPLISEDSKLHLLQHHQYCVPIEIRMQMTKPGQLLRF